MKVNYDAFVSVQNLINNADLNSILKKLEEKDLIYCRNYKQCSCNWKLHMSRYSKLVYIKNSRLDIIIN